MSTSTMCCVCTVRPVAMARVDYCFTCWPGGPVTPPPCLRCGSRSLYYATGLCQRCHPSAIPPPDACRNCHGWGATRHLKWLCKGCNAWCRTHTRRGACRLCGHDSVLDPEGVCRLCRKQAALYRATYSVHVPLEETGRGGQQLFIADLFTRNGAPRPRPGRPYTPLAAPCPQQPAAPPPPPLLGFTQLLLFDTARSLCPRGVAELTARADPDLANWAEQFTAARARQHGWNPACTGRVRTAVNVMLGFQSAPGALIAASDITVLAQVGLPVDHARTVLADAGLLLDDRLPAVILWARRRLRDLPAAIRTEMDTWVHITLHGQDTPPRRRPRTDITARAYVTWALPALTCWAAAGRQSLREITPDDIRAALPADPTARALMGQALRSVFSLLKAQQLIFTDPARGIKTGSVAGKIPLPVPADDIRQALTSPQPARALLTALIAFHGLTSRHLQHLHLTHLDGTHLTVNDRTIPLAAPVMQRLTAYLEHRSQRWPATTNPHLFIHLRTATSDRPVGPLWINRTLGPALTPRRLREDRYLHEAHATAGDAKALTCLFDLSTKAAQRYTRTVHPPPLCTAPEPVSEPQSVT